MVEVSLLVLSLFKWGEDILNETVPFACVLVRFLGMSLCNWKKTENL